MFANAFAILGDVVNLRRGGRNPHCVLSAHVIWGGGSYIPFLDLLYSAIARNDVSPYPGAGFIVVTFAFLAVYGV